MKKHSKNKSNRQTERPDKEIMLSVPNKAGKSAKFVGNNSQNNVKYDKNGKQIATTKSARTGKLTRKKLIIIIVAVLLAIVVIVGAVCFFANRDSERKDDDTAVQEPEEPEEPEPLENTDPLTSEPDEIDPATYQVAAYKPRFLSIPSLNLTNIPVTEVGWVNGNQLGSPKSTRVAGWFYRSAIPGERGPAIINAHGGDLGTGIFKTLPQIKMGDEIIIEMGDGRKFTYVVGEIAFKKLGAEANQYMNVAFQSLVPGVPSLTLITCTGTWLPNQQTYDQRLYVRAALK